MIDMRLSFVDRTLRNDDNFKLNEVELLEYIWENRGEIPIFDYRYETRGQYCLDNMMVYWNGTLLVTFRENLIDPTDIIWNLDYSDKILIEELPEIFFDLLTWAKQSRLRYMYD